MMMGSTTVLELLSSTLIFFTLIWSCQWFWNRRKLYREAAKVHGPKGLPILGSSLHFIGNPRDIYNKVMEVFDTYPELGAVWFGPNLVWSISKPDYLETVLNHPGALEKMYLYKFAREFMGLGLFTAEVPRWKRHRKLILPAFNQKILDTFVDIFSEQYTVLMKKLDRFVDGPEFDIFPELSKCTLDIVCRTAMNVEMNAQTTDSDLYAALDRIMEITIVRMFTIYFHFDWIFEFSTLYKELRRTVAKFHAFTDAIVKTRRAEYDDREFVAPVSEGLSEKRKIFLDLLLETTKLSNAELRDEVNTFMIAGSDTTASSSGFLFVVLGLFPEIQEKVFREVMEVVGPDRNVTAQDLTLLKYTERVVKETQRFFPVGAFIVRDITEDITLSDDVTLPAGSSAILGIMHVHRNPQHWPEPQRFDPDRFLQEPTRKRHPYAYLPFSGGPRNCPGNKYAMMAMKSMAAMLVRRYRFGTTYGNIEDVALKANIMIKPIGGYRVSITKR